MAHQQVPGHGRLAFVDAWRLLLVALVVLDHAVHAYSPRFADLWFLPDNDRAAWCDVFHLHNDAIMMPSLFFIAGLFVLPALERYGWRAFLRERFVRLVVPFVVGWPLVSPLLTYLPYVRDHGPTSFGTFLSQVWIHEPEVGPFWFLSYLVVLNAGAVVLWGLWPGCIAGLARRIAWLMARPALGFVLMGTLLAATLTCSDQIWGGPWWIGLTVWLRVRGSRFLVEGGLFWLGIAVAAAGCLRDERLWDRLAAYWVRWVEVTVAIGIAYLGYTLTWFDHGAYSDAARHFYRDALDADVPRSIALRESLAIAAESITGVAVRTGLLGFFVLSHLLGAAALCRRFFDQPSPVARRLSRASFGVYLVHEPIVTALHAATHAEGWPVAAKFALTGTGGLLISFLLVDALLLRIPAVRRVLG